MQKTEKMILALLILAALLPAALFGIREDKAFLFAPAALTVYLAAAALGLLRAGRRGPEAGDREQGTGGGGLTSGFRLPPAGVPLLLFVLYSFARIPFSVLPYEAKISSLCLGAYVAVYWISATLLTRFSYRRTVWTAVFFFLVAVALYSLVQHKAAPNLLFGMERYTEYWRKGWEGGRLGGTYQCPNHIAHLYQMWIPLCLVFLGISRMGWFRRICFAYGLPLFALLIYQTQSRAGLLGLIAAVGTTVLFMILQKSRRAFCIALLVVPLLGAGAAGGLWFGSAMFRNRMQPVVKFFEHQMNEDLVEEEFRDFRPQTWLDSLDMIKERPVFGFGPGNYGQVFEAYRKRFTGVRISTVHAHNDYVELLAEYGLTGGVLVLWILIGFAVRAVRFIRTSPNRHHTLPVAALMGALAGTAVHSLFDFEIRIFPNAMMLALLAGCAAAPMGQSAERREQRARSRPKIFVFRLLSSAVLLLSALWAVQVMSSSAVRAAADEFYGKQDFPRSERLHGVAAKIDPQNWRAHLGLGRVYHYYRYYELDPDRKQAWARRELAAHERAFRINFKKDEVRYGLARAELFLGNRERGLDLLRELAVYKSFNDFYWRKLGIELRKAGLLDEALAAFEHAHRLDRSNPTVRRNIEWIRKRQSGAR